MRSARILGATLAMVAVSAVAATSASAAVSPELENALGGVLGKNGVSGLAAKTTLETKSGEKVACEAATTSGTVANKRMGSRKVKLTKCTAFGLNCATAGAPAGTIEAEANTRLVYLSEVFHTAGLLTEFKEFTISCAGIEKLTVRNNALGGVTPVNKFVPANTAAFDLTFSQTKGVQEPTEYEESGKKVKPKPLEIKGEGIKSFGFEQSGLVSSETLEFEEEAQIKA